MPRLLIIEDDPLIVEAVEKTLGMAPGFVLAHAPRAQDAVAAAAAGRPDLILLDVRLPDGDGRMILKSLKTNAATRLIPVILLTGLSSEGDKVLGLNLGADDYVVKPFGALELLARVQAVLRRSAPAGRSAETISLGGLTLDAAGRRASFKGRELKLQPREFEILLLLASNPGRTLSRSFLIENSSSYGMAVATRSLDTHVKNLRRKLGPGAALIETMPKLGYRFAA